MAIIDLFKKKKAEEAVQEKAEATSAPQEEKSAAEKGKERRYTLMVEEAFESARYQGIMAMGNLHGKLKEGDTLYLYRPNMPVIKVEAEIIETAPQEMSEMAKNQRVAVGIGLENVDDVPRYSVLSSVPPQEQVSETVPVENPYLFGMMMEYKRLYENPGYMNCLLHGLCTANLLEPLYMDQPPLPNPDGTLSFGEGANVGIRSIRKWDDENASLFPAFTDLGALHLWKDAFHPDQPKRTLAFNMPAVLDHVERGHAGLIVNPFGPVPVFFKAELLQTVKNSEGYQKLFPETKKAAVEEETEQQ